MRPAQASLGGKEEGFDLESSLPLPGGGRVRLCIKCKSVLHPGDVPRLAERVKNGLPDDALFMLAVPWVSERLADLCGQGGLELV